MNHQNPKRSEIEKRKTLGNIMKFQDLKLEKERERNPRSKKRQRIEQRERENLWHGGSMGAVLREEYDLRYWFCENEMEKTRSKILM